MTRLVTLALLLPALAACKAPLAESRESAPVITPAAPPATPAVTSPVAEPGFIYGRVTTTDDRTYEGRLRWGGDQEAFWTDYFNGTKAENPWAAYTPGADAANGRRIDIFGIQLGGEQPTLRRLFMAPFGGITRIERQFREVKVTLKSQMVVTLDRFSAGDIDDGVRVWDRDRGMVDIESGQIRTIELLEGRTGISTERRLYGTVHTARGDFTGLIEWNQQDGLMSDTLDGDAPNGPVRIRYDAIRSVARRSPSSAIVALLDGRELVLSNHRDVGKDHHGIYVDDPRYGRVLISWDVFERADFAAGRRPPAYADYPAGRPLHATVTTRDDRRLSGRVVYDLDESETNETLDAASMGVDYNIPFALIAAVVPRGVADSARPRVILRDGEELSFDRTGDLGDRHAGLLIFTGSEHPQYVAWPDVARIDFVP